MLTTHTGGRTWSAQKLAAPYNDAGRQVVFVDRGHGWIVCGRTIYATTDGGRHWTAQQVAPKVDALAFADALHGWAAAESSDGVASSNGWVSDSGAVLTTTTGGFTSGS